MKFTLLVSALAVVAAAEPAANGAHQYERKQVSAFNTASALNVLATALPGSLISLAITNQGAASSLIASEFAAGETPSWFSALPPAIKTYLVPAARATSNSTAAPFAAGNSTAGMGVAGGTAGASGTGASGAGVKSTLTGGMTASTGSGATKTTGSSSGGATGGAGGSGSGSSSSTALAAQATVFMGAVAGAAGLIGLFAL